MSFFKLLPKIGVWKETKFLQVHNLGIIGTTILIYKYNMLKTEKKNSLYEYEVDYIRRHNIMIIYNKI